MKGRGKPLMVGNVHWLPPETNCSWSGYQSKWPDAFVFACPTCKVPALKPCFVDLVGNAPRVSAPCLARLKLGEVYATLCKL